MDKQRIDAMSVKPQSTPTDSGYKTTLEQSSKNLVGNPPGVLIRDSEFKFHGSLAFITYTRSRIQKKEEFEKKFRQTIGEHLPRLKGSDESARGQLELYGCRELHEDGQTLHYHVVIRIRPRVHWRKARVKFEMFIRQGEVDTKSIMIRKKGEKESAGVFLQSVQAYITKRGDIFGEWIGARPASDKAASDAASSKQLREVETRQEAGAISREHFVRDDCLRPGRIQAFLRTKKQSPAVAHEPDFEVKEWCEPIKMKQWKSRNFGPGPGRRGGRPKPLVIIGESRIGKTEWALSFGRPGIMSTNWNVDALTKPDMTHLVLNDINLKKFPNAKDFAGCQRYITVSGKWREDRTIDFSLPVIWTCGYDNNVMEDKTIGKLLRENGATVVRLGKKKLWK